MSDPNPPVVLVVRGPTSARRESEIRRWIRALVPAALILVSSVPLDLRALEDVVTLTSEDVDAGPLAIAAALARPRPPRGVQRSWQATPAASMDSRAALT